VPPSSAPTVKLPKDALAGLKTEINTFPAIGPANTSKPIALALCEGQVEGVGERIRPKYLTTVVDRSELGSEDDHTSGS